MTDVSKAGTGATRRSVQYVIDPTRAGPMKRSLEHMLFTRRCPTCRSRLEKEAAAPNAATQIQEIAGCCGKAEDFIKPEMPLMEIVFRTVLAGGNRPIGLEELHQALTDTFATPMVPRNLSIEALRTILTRDDFYCLTELKQVSQ